MEEEPTITDEFPEEEVLPPSPGPPLSPRQNRTKELLVRFPGLSIPEAMRAAMYTIEESESVPLQTVFEGDIQKKEKRSRRPAGSQMPHPTKMSAPLLNTVDPEALPEGIVLCAVRPKNHAGRCLCRVEGCRKLDQANNDGFCRAHYNLIVGKDSENEEVSGATGEPWTCDSCQSMVSFHQKRCGNCHRELYSS